MKGSVFAQVKQPLHSSSFDLCFSRTDNGITHQRSFSLYPILLWPLPAFVRIHHNNSPDPNLHHQASPCFLSLSGERLNLDQNEKFICTQQLMAILIWYNCKCSISTHFSFSSPNNFLNTLLFLVFASHTILLWVILNPSGPLGFDFVQSRIAKYHYSFPRSLEICLSHFRWDICTNPGEEDLGESALSIAR